MVTPTQWGVRDGPRAVPYNPQEMEQLLIRLGKHGNELTSFEELAKAGGPISGVSRRYARFWRDDARAGLPEAKRRGWPTYRIGGIYLLLTSDVDRWRACMKTHGLTDKSISQARKLCSGFGNLSAKDIARRTGLSIAAIEIACRDLPAWKKRGR